MLLLNLTIVLNKAWVRLFTSVYQTKDVTPYIHALGMHVSEFLHLYGNIVMFNQQGLEKLNDLTTKPLPTCFKPSRI